MTTIEQAAQVMEQAAVEIERLRASNAELLSALKDMVGIIDAAGLQNLSNGVQLGATSWFVKASDRREWALTILAKAEGRS